MNKNRNPLIVILLSLLFLAQGCASTPEVTEPALLPTKTEDHTVPTVTLIPSTPTLIPPTPTPTREVIANGNVQRLISAWDFSIQDDSFRTVAYLQAAKFLPLVLVRILKVRIKKLGCGMCQRGNFWQNLKKWIPSFGS